MPRPRARRVRSGATLVVALVAALPALLAGCSDDEPRAGAAAPSPPPGPWTWTDDLDQTVELDEAPMRIAAYGDEAAALWRFGIVPVAVFDYIDPALDPSFIGLPLDQTEVVGTSDGQIDLDRLAELEPDLIVTASQAGDTQNRMHGFEDYAQLHDVREIAPVIAVEQSGSAFYVAEQNEKLAASLGVDVGPGSTVAADKEELDQATAALTQAAASGLTVMPVYADFGGLYVLDHRDDPTMAYLDDHGVDFVKRGGEDDYWEILDWSNADKYEPDVVLVSQRGGFTADELATQMTFGRLGAVQRRQMHPWRSVPPDYRALAAYVREMTTWLISDQDVD
jgi:iron-desferrioxamine transport system substrate-binding protein